MERRKFYAIYVHTIWSSDILYSVLAIYLITEYGK